MDNLYIDFTGSIPLKGIEFHGGRNYTIWLLNLIIRRKNLKKNIIILWPKDYLPRSKEEKDLKNYNGVKILAVKNLCELTFKKNSIIFFPLQKTKNMKIAKVIKSKNPSVRIYLTIHGLRPLDLKYDKYDRYFDNNRKYKIYTFFYYFFKKIIYKKIFKKFLPYYDKIFTDSNYSLQQIVKLKDVKFINFYYLNIIKKNNLIKNKIKDEFVLFVSAGVMIKNFARTLKAFCNYKSKNKNELHMYVTGLNKDRINKIFRYFNEEEKKVIREWVKIFDYIDSDFLWDFYKQCKFLLYTSKSEGFGLPIIEAMFNNRPVVASYLTSIPEVAYEHIVKGKVPIIKKLAYFDQEMLINEILD